MKWLQRSDVFTITDEIFKDVEYVNPQYFTYLNEISKDVTKMDIKDLREDLISTNKKESEKTWKEIVKQNGKITTKTRSIFTDGGQIFVRKWLSEGFVSVIKGRLQKIKIKSNWNVCFSST
jgi:hypothetical protein